jgi:hypothetical protein
VSYHGEQLVKLRNPWGRSVWTGKWSPTSNEYKRAPDDLLKTLDMKRSGDKDFTHGEFVLRSDEFLHCKIVTHNFPGEFVMAWADFVAVYDNVCLAIVQPKGWMEATVTGRWPAAPKHMWHFRSLGEQYSLEVRCVFGGGAAELLKRVTCDV